MERRNLLIIGAAVLFGLVAVYFANTWFSGVERQQEKVTEQRALTRIAVADQDLAFGTALSSVNVRLVAWPVDSVPQGAYREGDAQRLLGAGNVAIRPIARGEPILLSRISERAVLSANIPPDMRAVTVPVDAVSGVAGFVTPGDVVDVLLTRQIPGDGASNDDKMTTIVLDNVQVLAVDLRAGEQNTNPAESKTATLMVHPEGAQQLALATQIGRLSLALRNVEDPGTGTRRVVTSRELGGGLFIPARRGAGSPVPQTRGGVVAAPPGQVVVPPRPSGPGMTVIRGTETSFVGVQRHGF